MFNDDLDERLFNKKQVDIDCVRFSNILKKSPLRHDTCLKNYFIPLNKNNVLPYSKNVYDVMAVFGDIKKGGS